MSALMDMALEDIIKNNRSYGERSQRGRGRGRGNARGAATGAFRRVRTSATVRAAPYKPKRREPSNFDEDTVWEHDLYQDEEEEEEEQVEQQHKGGRVRAIETGTKLKISNLDYNVAEENLQELFETVGAVKKVTIKYDRSGRSEGEAEVVFSRRADAQSAMRKFQGTKVDGKAIRLAILGSNLAVGEGSRMVADHTASEGLRSERRVIRPTGFLVSASRGVRRLRVGGNRGGMVRRGGRRGGRQMEVTADQLDAELDNYNSMKG